MKSFNPCQANAPFLYIQKALENLRFFMFLGGMEREHWPEMYYPFHAIFLFLYPLKMSENLTFLGRIKMGH